MPPSTTPARSSAIKTKTKTQSQSLALRDAHTHTQPQTLQRARMKRRRRPPRARETPRPTRALDQKINPRPFRRPPFALARSRTRQTATPNPIPGRRSVRSISMFDTHRSENRAQSALGDPRRDRAAGHDERREKSSLRVDGRWLESRRRARACGDVRARRATRGLAGRALV